jgi:hypothetical protein
MIAERDQRLQEIDAWADGEIEKLPAHGGDHRNRWIEFNRQRDEKKKSVQGNADAAVADREARFWSDSWEYRQKVVELDHLIGEYWERWMAGRTQVRWNWAGMGEPDPPWPVEFTVPLFR